MSNFSASHLTTSSTRSSGWNASGRITVPCSSASVSLHLAWIHLDEYQLSAGPVQQQESTDSKKVQLGHTTRPVIRFHRRQHYRLDRSHICTEKTSQQPSWTIPLSMLVCLPFFHYGMNPELAPSWLTLSRICRSSSKEHRSRRCSPFLREFSEPS
jgi:hypothetical protein